MIANTFFKSSHANHKRVLEDDLKDVEHFRTYDFSRRIDDPDEEIVRSNTAVVVLNDGRCYVGKSYCSTLDKYNPRRGYEIALGRALKDAADDLKAKSGWSFSVPTSLAGRALRDACREALTSMMMVYKFNSPEGPVA